MFVFENLPLAPIDRGTNVLVAGPVLGSTQAVFLRMVAPVRGEGGVVLVSTASSGGELVRALETTVERLDRRAVGVVDASGSEELPDVGDARQASGPTDLAAIGHDVSDIHETFIDQGAQRVRIGVESLSRVLMNLDLETVFRFLQVTTERIAAADGLGVYIIDPGSHDDQTIQTLIQLFDARIDVREPDGNGSRELRVRGLADQSREWQPF